MNSLIYNIRKAVSKNRTDLAISLLQDHFGYNSNDKVVLISSRYNKFKENERLGIEEANEVIKIHKSILEIADEINYLYLKDLKNSGNISAEEFEKLFPIIEESLRVSDKIEIMRNQSFPRKNGLGNKYVDISVRFKINNSIKFTIIFDCKNWGFPVDSKQIEQLVFDRDSLKGVSKAGIISPIGFTQEAIEVAKENDIVLWTIAKGMQILSAGGGLTCFSTIRVIGYHIRNKIKEFIRYNGLHTRKIISNMPEIMNREILPNTFCLIDYDTLVHESINPLLNKFRVGNDVDGKDPVLNLIVKKVIDLAINKPIEIQKSILYTIKTDFLFLPEILEEAGMKNKLHIASIEEAVAKIALGHDYEVYGVLEAIDSKVDHRAIELLAPDHWIEKTLLHNNYFLYSEDAHEKVRLSNNILWANLAWLFEQKIRDRTDHI